jgi:serine/threonine protein kinase/tetratricopeptide (TPR) repeat protein
MKEIIPGQIISHYRITEKLGQGGMGEVYKAEDIKLKRTVALKFLPSSFSFDEDAKKRFLNEAQSASALDHINICTIYEIGETDDGQLFISMAFYEGETLKDKITKSHIEKSESINIAIQICEGLDKAHKNEIIHRDIKPANIFITNDGIVKILDFGLAKSRGQTQLTQIGSIVGTVDYMSPEQATGSIIDRGTDIWSFGVLLFEMLSGQLPFKAEYEQAVIYSILNAEPNLDLIEENLRMVILKCLEKDRNNRYKNVDELIVDLRRIKEGQTINPRIQESHLPPFLSDNKEITYSEKTIFVERENELERLGKFLEFALTGNGQVAFITGEAGTGKTTLIREFVRASQEKNSELIVVTGKCNAHTGIGDPYFPFIELLNLLTGDVESKYNAGSLSKEHILRLWNLLPISAQAILENGPDLINIFTSGSSLVSRASALSHLHMDWLEKLKKEVQRRFALPADLTRQQSNLFEQYNRVVQAIAKVKPLLLILDDLQWIDSGSAGLLFHIGRQIRGHRIFILGSFRPSEISMGREQTRHPIEPIFNELKRDFGDIELNLDTLESFNFVENYIDTEPNALNVNFRRTFFNLTKGQPLFTAELLRFMKGKGFLIKNEKDEWIEGKVFMWNKLPSKVDAVISERIGQLTDKIQEILKLASVEGEEFTTEVLASLSKEDIGELIRILSSELDKRHHLISAKGLKNLGKQRVSVYIFQNILFQKYLYNSLDEVERVHIHEKIGNFLESNYSENVDNISIQLAWHFQEAGLMPKALEYLCKAGTKALYLSAYDETIAHFNKALAILKTFPQSPMLDQQELSIQMALAAALQATKGFGAPDVVLHCDRIEELCGKFEQVPQVFYSLIFLTNFHWQRGNHNMALNTARQMMNSANITKEPEKLAITHSIQGSLFFNVGKFSEAIGNLRKMNSFYDPAIHSNLKYMAGMDLGIVSGFTSASVLWCLGYPDQALMQSKKMLTTLRQIDHPFSMAVGLALDTLFLLLQRNFDEMEKMGWKIYKFSEEKGFIFFMGVGIFKIGFAMVHQGKVDEGINKLHQALQLYTATGVRFTLTDLLGSLAEAYGIAGQIGKGLDILEKAIEEVERGGERYYEAELYRIKGELLLKKEDSEVKEALEKEAEDCFKRSIKIAQFQKAKSFELRSAMSLCRLWEGQNKNKTAKQLLVKIYNWFTEGFETYDLMQASNLLKELKNLK